MFLFVKEFLVALLLFKEKSERPYDRPSEHPPVRGGKMSKRLGRIKGCKMQNLFMAFKAVVKRKHPRIPAFQPFMKPVSYFLQEQFHAVQRLYQL